MNTKVVLLNPTEPSQGLKDILSDPMYLRRVQYVKGQELSFHSLNKAKFHESKGCFILSGKYFETDVVRESRVLDSEVVTRALVYREFLLVFFLFL